MVQAIQFWDVGFDGLLIVGRHFSAKNVVSIMHDIHRQERNEGPSLSAMVYSLLILCNIGKN
jgi:tyrosyl-tRNA synthetase